MKPSERDLEKARHVFWNEVNGRNRNEWENQHDIESIAKALAAERANLPKSVKEALVGALEFYDNHCSAEDEECELKTMSTKQIQKAIAELDEWLKG